MFLGYIVNQWGIEENPEKIKALFGLRSPTTKKKVQNLTGQVAALNRFVSRATDRCLPFFKTLRKTFEWNGECEKAFQELKKYLGAPPLLSRLVMGERLYLYLAVSENAISSALIRMEDGMQKPIYYTSKAFWGAEIRYPRLEKLALALIEASRGMRSYFQDHTIVVYTDMPLRQALHKPEKSGRLMYWAVELEEYDIIYEPRSSLKGQAVADFIVEFTQENSAEE